MKRPSRHTLAATALTACLLPLAACGTEQDAGDSAGDPSETSTTPSDAIAHPTGPDDVVLQVLVSGGYVPYEYAISTRPRVTVYGDGTAVVAAERDDLRRMVVLRTAHLGEDDVQELLHLADDAGLLADPPDYDRKGPMVTDMATTTLTLDAGDGTFQHAAYALGFSGGGDDADTPERTALSDYIAEAVKLVDAADLSSYVPTEVGLYVDSQRGGADEHAKGAAAWPVDGIDLSDGPGCREVTAEQAEALTEVLGQATFDRTFTQDGRTYSVVGVQLLPGEECPVDQQ